jgi:hypothetical protein
MKHTSQPSRYRVVVPGRVTETREEKAMSKPEPTTILAATADGRAVNELQPAMISDVRELASRESDGLTVVLCWHPREYAVTLAVSDSRNGERFELPVASDRALEAFYHPFGYAA